MVPGLVACLGVSARKRIVWAGLLLILAALLGAWIFREPSHGGRRLSDWLADATGATDGSPVWEVSGQNRRATEAVEGIRAIGAKAVPHLVRMLGAKETLLGAIHRGLRNEWLNRKNSAPTPHELRRRGFAGLLILGPLASNGVPKVAAMLEREPMRVDLWLLVAEMGGASAAPGLFEGPFREFTQGASDRWKEQEGDFHPAWLASDLVLSWSGPEGNRIEDQLRAKTNTLVQRVAAVWALRKNAELARHLMPAMAGIIADPSEPALLKIACLHGLGRIPRPEGGFITGAIDQFEKQFGALSAGAIQNGDFTGSNWSGLTQIPEDPKAPSAIYTNWLTWNGVVGRSLTTGGLRIDLGPREPPGAISQVFRTEPDTVYELRFDAAIGRNVRIHVAVGDLDSKFIPASNDPTKPAKVSFEFKALSPLTTLTIGAVEYEGYGPFIDNVNVKAKAW